MEKPVDLSCMTLGFLKNILPGAHTDESEQCRARDGFEEILRLAAEAGYRNVDVSSRETDAFGIPFVKKLLEKYNLGVASYIQFDPTLMLARPSEENALYREAIDNAHALGSRITMLVPRLTGAALQLKGETRAANLIENLAAASEYAKRYSMIAAVENRPDLEIPLCKAQELDRLFQAAPDVMLCYDSANMYLAGETQEVFLEKFTKKICYVHLKDIKEIPSQEARGNLTTSGRRFASVLHGTGIVDFELLAKKLKASNYHGAAAVEYMPAFWTRDELAVTLCELRIYFEKILS